MQVDIKTTDIHPVRQTFSQVARRIGEGKAASRYQEATLDMQPTTNWHYRPLWEPERHVFDPRRTNIVMADWYAFKDPRHYYYGVYTMARAKQQEGADKQFEFAEKRNLLGGLDDATRDALVTALIPLRHYEWGSNMNNTYCCAYGYGTAVTQACNYAAMDRLGIAQYLSRIGLMIDGSTGTSLDAAKQQWLLDPTWQPLRRLVEDSLVVKDWFELTLLQNLVSDGLLFPLIYQKFDETLTAEGAGDVGMLTEFMRNWYAESTRWVDAMVKTVAAESPENRAQIEAWVDYWQGRAIEALAPLAEVSAGQAALAEVQQAFAARLKKIGLFNQ